MRAIGLFLAAALLCGSVYAAVPHQINYQGYLTATGGTPVNATVSMALKIYDVSTGGAALYTETQMVTVTNGVFNVAIGSVMALPLPFDVPYWLGIKIGADPEMTPREELIASPYAIRSASTESLAPTALVPAAQITGTVSSAANFTGALAGDVTGTQGATAVGTVGGVTAANVAAGANLAIAATNANIANTLVRRDASGNLAAGTIVAAGDLNLSATNAAGTAGVINQAGSRWVHSFGNANFFAGSGAGNFSMTGGNNTGTGANALSASTSGGQNTANGSQALPANTDGGQNTATGYAALLGNTSGGNNTAIGVNALQANMLGNFNTAGGAAALASSTGSSNTAIGFGAGSNLTAGDNNVYIGNAGVTTESNTVRIGNPAVHAATLLAGRVGIPSTSTSAVLPTKLNVVADSPKATIATTRALAVTTNDASNPFALDIKVVGAAAIANRGIILQTTDWNLLDGGNLLLQPQGGNVGIGANGATSKLTVAGLIESTSGGVKFPDTTVQLTAARKPQRVLVVAPSGGDFTSISAALASIADNSASVRYLVYVGPGTYTERVTMKPFVDIQGAGELVTRITFGGNISSNTGTVIGASNAELRFLSAENTGGNQYAVAIYNNAAAVRLTHVSANAFGGTQLSVGVLNDALSSPTIKDVTASGTGSAINAGVYNQDSSATINSSVISATGGSPNWGIKNTQNFVGAYTVLVNNSQIIGSDNTVRNDTFFTMRVGASQLSGGPVFTAVGTLTCAGVYDENYVFSASTCP